MAKLEINIELEFVNIALQKYGCIAFKFKREAIKGGSDRLVFCPKGHSFFIEFKRPVGSVSEHQIEFGEMMDINFNKKVYFCFSLDDALNVLQHELQFDKDNYVV